ncbi:hypothetical protein Trihar35433_247 [Trichoderma harzianum]|nr:hypothetical protein Trihar35433_247 [Trichoderma harzianum]
MASTPMRTVTETLTEQGVNNKDLLIRSCLRLTASLDVDQASRPDLSRTFEQGGKAGKLLPHHVPLDAAISNLLGVSTTFAHGTAHQNTTSPRRHIAPCAPALKPEDWQSQQSMNRQGGTGLEQHTVGWAAPLSNEGRTIDKFMSTATPPIPASHAPAPAEACSTNPDS